MAKYEKMSKSRGNVVLPEEVTYGVYELDPRYEFRDENENIIDYNEIQIWQNKSNDGFYYTTTKFGRRPVFLCVKGEPVPCMLKLGQEECLQHPDFYDYWLKMVEKYNR